MSNINYNRAIGLCVHKIQLRRCIKSDATILLETFPQYSCFGTRVIHSTEICRIRTSLPDRNQNLNNWTIVNWETWFNENLRVSLENRCPGRRQQGTRLSWVRSYYPINQEVRTASLIIRRSYIPAARWQEIPSELDDRSRRVDPNYS